MLSLNLVWHFYLYVFLNWNKEIFFQIHSFFCKLFLFHCFNLMNNLFKNLWLATCFVYAHAVESDTVSDTDSDADPYAHLLKECELDLSLFHKDNPFIKNFPHDKTRNWILMTACDVERHTLMTELIDQSLIPLTPDMVNSWRTGNRLVFLNKLFETPPASFIQWKRRVYEKHREAHPLDWQKYDNRMQESNMRKRMGLPEPYMWNPFDWFAYELLTMTKFENI